MSSGTKESLISPLQLETLSGVEATFVLAQAIETKSSVRLGEYALTRIRQVSAEGRTIVVSAALETGGSMLLKYGIDDQPVIEPTTQILGD